LLGVSALAAGIRIPAMSETLQSAAPAIWSKARRHPYERTPLDPERGEPVKSMNDISRHPSTADVIALRGVNLSLGRGAARVHILRNIEVNIGRGEAVSLLGPSGSGKSTLLMVMTGLERPDSGSVMVAGEQLQDLDEDQLARFRGRSVGIVFQAFHLIPTMTALENVAVPLELAGAGDAIERARRELAAVGLAERVHHYPAELSGGEQQRVAVARALAPNPAIVVADEPTGNLDEATGSEVIELLFRGHSERGTTLVLVTHDTALAARCDRVLQMRSGRLENRVGAIEIS
jgi:putative ABC transport system ATP-binding protein